MYYLINMEKNIHKYKIFGRRKGRKKNLHNFDQYFLRTILKKNIQLDRNNHNILDIGSGSGENSIYLSKKFPNSQIIACDNFEDGNLNLCKSIFISHLNNILKKNGNAHIVTDSKSYLRQILNLVYHYRQSYIWKNQIKGDWEFDPDKILKTKFYKKALKYDRKPIYIKLSKL